MTRINACLLTTMIGCALAASVRAQVTAAPGFAVAAVATPDTVQGDVVQAGGAILVGQGSFGPGLQSVVRLDGGGATTIAAGFGGLGGFSLAPDGTLYVVDNCYTGDFGCAAATTGDTAYAIPDALTRTTAVAAADAELLPAGSIPFAQDVLALEDRLLVSDAAGPGAGRVVQVMGGVATPIVSGLGFTAGLALDGGTLLVGDIDGSFVGSVTRYTQAGFLLGPLAGGLSGTFGVDFDPLRAAALVTGGFTPDFSSSTLAAIAPGGAVSERAHGFGFSGGVFHDVVRDEALVLDFGVSEVSVVCADPDGDATCDPPCPAPVAATGARIVVKGLATPAGDESITVKGIATLPNPANLDSMVFGLRVVVLSAAEVVVGHVLVPPGAFDPSTGAGWSANAAQTRWKYRNPNGPAGVTVAKVIKLGTGDVKFVVRGKLGARARNDGTLPLSARVVLDDAGQCAATAVAGCTTSTNGDVVKCR
jgi:hypothetical protein